MNSGDLERRALAAAAEAQAKWEAREREEKRRREEEERRSQAKEARAARRGAVRRLEEILGHQTSPSEWGIWGGDTRGQGRYGGRWANVTFATLKLMGVDVRGNENYLEVYGSPGSTDFRDAAWHELTLVSFGYVLERRSPPGSPPGVMDDPLARRQIGRAHV